MKIWKCPYAPFADLDHCVDGVGDSVGAAMSVRSEQALHDNCQRKFGHLGCHIENLASRPIVPCRNSLIRGDAHGLTNALQAVAVKRRLHKLPLAAPLVAVAGDYAVTEKWPQLLVEIALAVVAPVGHEDVFQSFRAVEQA